MAKTDLLLVRHGETEENVRHILQGHLPGRLTADGLRQAQELAEQLAGQPFDILLTSDLERARRTAEVLAEALSLQPIEDVRLRERDWGELTGLPVECVKGQPFPPSVETVTEMTRRAEDMLDDIYSRYMGQRIVCVTHGLFARVLQAAYYGVSLREIQPMRNAETRLLQLPRPTRSPLVAQIGETGAAES